MGAWTLGVPLSTGWTPNTLKRGRGEIKPTWLWERSLLGINNISINTDWVSKFLSKIVLSELNRFYCNQQFIFCCNKWRVLGLLCWPVCNLARNLITKHDKHRYAITSVYAEYSVGRSGEFWAYVDRVYVEWWTWSYLQSKAPGWV